MLQNCILYNASLLSSSFLVVPSLPTRIRMHDYIHHLLLPISRESFNYLRLHLTIYLYIYYPDVKLI